MTPPHKPLSGPTRNLTVRVVIIDILTEVLSDRTHLDEALTRHSQALTDIRDRRLAQEVCYGVMRWYYQLDAIVAKLLLKPMRKRDTRLLLLIMTGLYQLKYLRIPDHAAISETVETAKITGLTRAAGMVNALLRRYQRERTLIDAAIADDPVALYSHPSWLIDRIRTQWPAEWQDILIHNNLRPPLHLRLNQGRMSRDKYSSLLQAKEIDHQLLPWVDSAIKLEKAVNVESIPGFMEGLVTVQDIGAQLAAPLLNPQAGENILDACAAPGGKTGHILELTRGMADVTAIEIDSSRATLLAASLARLGMNAQIINSDVTRVDDWWDGRLFDRILIDAPCSASGVIRRHPDIKFLRQPSQLAFFCSIQQKILSSLWPLLKAGGRLVYSTCSIFDEESDSQIAGFSNQYNDMIIEPLDLEWGQRRNFGCQIIPDEKGSDGFYYSVLIKTS